MSQENVERLREGLEAFNRGGFDAVDQTFWADDIVWDVRPTGIPGLGVYRGREQVRRFFEEDWFAAFSFQQWELGIETLIDCGGDRVLCFIEQRGRGSASGAPVGLKFAQLVTLREGLVVHVEAFLDPEEALEAAGLSE